MPRKHQAMWQPKIYTICLIRWAIKQALIKMLSCWQVKTSQANCLAIRVKIPPSLIGKHSLNPKVVWVCLFFSLNQSPLVQLWLQTHLGVKISIAYLDQLLRFAYYQLIHQ